jgi:hypothetical protein
MPFVPSKRRHSSWTYLIQGVQDEIEIIDDEVLTHVQTINRELSAIGLLHFKHPIRYQEVERLLSIKYDTPCTKIASLPVIMKNGKVIPKLKYIVTVTP